MVRGFSESIVSDYENVYCCLGLSLFELKVDIFLFKIILKREIVFVCRKVLSLVKH